jgi:hypothetical protein
MGLDTLRGNLHERSLIFIPFPPHRLSPSDESLPVLAQKPNLHVTSNSFRLFNTNSPHAFARPHAHRLTQEHLAQSKTASSTPPDVLCNQSPLRYSQKNPQKAPPNPKSLPPNMDFATTTQQSRWLQQAMLKQGRPQQSKSRAMQPSQRLSKAAWPRRLLSPDD